MWNKSKRIYQLGLKKSAVIGIHRMQQWLFATYWRKRIGSYHQKEIPCAKMRTLLFVNALCPELDHTSCITSADEITAGYLSLLGAQKKIYPCLPWHTDIRLAGENPKADASFESSVFYRDITIAAGQHEMQLGKDIKVPWELSRSQQLPILGHAYMLTKNERYAKKIVEWVCDWQNSNSFLCGVNWCNPMEVGLRAINWIVAVSMIAESSTITQDFLRKITSSLYEHLLFIEGNWEWYDGKTSNHYLSDLVGYLYLSWFLGYRKKFLWAVAALEQEMRKQVLSDGGDYEGSTRYHRLVTELFAYAQQLVEQERAPLSAVYVEKHIQMDDFLWWNTPYNGTLVTVGDDDSGCVLPFAYAGRKKGDDAVVSFFFQDFGLSVYKTKKAHVTLRHYAVTAEQPTGHFHNDIGSITLAVNGVPLIVDPGSYVYTPSVQWRNYFRSARVHNTAYVQGEEPIALTSHLFNLAMPSRINTDSIFSMHHALYYEGAVSFKRTLTCSDVALIINDEWLVPLESSQQTLVWNFTLHPEIEVQQNDAVITFMHKDTALATIQSDQLSFEVEPAFVALQYGEKKASKCIRAYAPFATMKVVITILL